MASANERGEWRRRDVEIGERATVDDHRGIWHFRERHDLPLHHTNDIQEDQP